MLAEEVTLLEGEVPNDRDALQDEVTDASGLTIGEAPKDKEAVGERVGDGERGEGSAVLGTARLGRDDTLVETDGEVCPLARGV